jgi:folate-dependent tRNA-U54 methylase TrmFO/GidA
MMSDDTLQLGQALAFLAGQVSGVEGYVESAAMGCLRGERHETA